ncbi:MAG: Hsp70 family protein [Alteromonas macleodii]|jgi:molecular chaperone DnaK|uniref:Hsp70 family protein n=1 Tax=Alteromonas TaxID=226 RepID=UPI0007764739|nr:Hsp70 family protein [Alteromonas macleodii]AMN10636.1 heat-shock protein Hsp70 [Alteromonas macleodii]MDM7962546.1 Hsp70 family protein [Alteromonas macleodii]MDM8171098.1 Hsp70 family protein [Alteromonas macleodii]CAI3933652.1 molecular chaperone DnaK [Alteromonas macleodii]VTP52511.1 molecular chaperone DnaK [Alteromonas macleodii]|tara:strand:+ start:2100 stop:4595 length:2496 start_codon:yes stop_codon:yes gene_type:complete
MKNFVGIDLGTTNSAICTYDGESTRVWKSPEQNDVTPSAIYIDKRGNKYVGKRAYDSAPHSPNNSALLFKRLMGTSTPIELKAIGETKTPEECSAEVLKVLYGYLPEEIRNDPNTGTVITVPAAFNQMQKDATMHAAEMAGLGNVALMQEPVAAVMSVMKARNTDGIFLIYDLGGGTLDIAIAESIGGRVNLLAHGGIAMCGGRDFDRVLFDNVVKPWLFENFNLPDDLSVNPDFKSLMRLANWATEKAKIELSSREESVISLSESETRARDLSGEEIYIDIPITRQTLDELIEERVTESVTAARETLSKAGLSAHDVERVVFVGGPTNYKPLRDKVAFELGIPGTTDVNPMTAVAEGASLFAESIEWKSDNRARKSNRGQVSSQGDLKLSFNYISRTPDTKAKIALQIKGEALPGAEFQIDSVDTGWTSGKMALQHGAIVSVTLSKQGENTFKISVTDSSGGPVPLGNDEIVITKTAATVDAIPASHSIGIEVLEKLGGKSVLDYLVRAGDSLPKKGKKVFKAAESLKAGVAGSLNLKIWEGDIEDPVTDNRPVGVLKISGSDFDDGVIPAGADLECDYEILDSGNIIIEVSVPSIGGVFHSGKNFYSRQEGQLDYTTSAAMVVEEGERTTSRIDELFEVIDDPKLQQAKDKAQKATSLDPDEVDTENAQEAMESVLEARKILAQVRKEHLKEIRQIDLNHAIDFFDKYLRESARPSEQTSFDSLAKTAQRSLERNDQDFEHHLDELRGKNFDILWRQDWFVVEKFKSMTNSPHLFADKARFQELAQTGLNLLKNDNIDDLRAIVAELSMIQIGGGAESDLLDVANILRG